MLYNTASYGRKIKNIEKRGKLMRTKKRNNKMMHNTIPTINTKYDAKFSISVLNVMPVNAEGDIVILPGVTE